MIRRHARCGYPSFSTRSYASSSQIGVLMAFGILVDTIEEVVEKNTEVRARLHSAYMKRRVMVTRRLQELASGRLRALERSSSALVKAARADGFRVGQRVFFAAG